MQKDSKQMMSINQLLKQPLGVKKLSSPDMLPASTPAFFSITLDRVSQEIYDSWVCYAFLNSSTVYRLMGIKESYDQYHQQFVFMGLQVDSVV